MKLKSVQNYKLRTKNSYFFFFIYDHIYKYEGRHRSNDYNAGDILGEERKTSGGIYVFLILIF